MRSIFYVLSLVLSEVVNVDSTSHINGFIIWQQVELFVCQFHISIQNGILPYGYVILYYFELSFCDCTNCVQIGSILGKLLKWLCPAISYGNSLKIDDGQLLSQYLDGYGRDVMSSETFSHNIQLSSL